LLDNQDLADQQYKTINAFGFGRKSKNQKKYIFGKLPMADAFIAWGRATALNYAHTDASKTKFWRLKFHLISVLVLLVFWLLFFWKKLYRYIKTIHNK